MATSLLIGVIRLYKRLISPLLPRACRFTPTCSVYAVEALATHGAWRGLRLTTWRLCRCHPWGGHGYDPVPPPRGGAHAEAGITARAEAGGESAEDAGASGRPEASR
jgi:putative membrane protein insertion efficiency factor